jgi:NAD(P)-dependent dehydrogenase (short-subunit alcohol dehydrogenase family)
VSPEDWAQTLTGSVGAAFFCTRAVIPQMKARQSGVIVNISTSSVKTGLPNRTPYVVAKAALEAFSTNCARELGRFNIRVNAIRPGALDNERMRKIIAGHATEKGCTLKAAETDFLRYFSMRALTGLDEVAEMAFFLASTAARHITGQCIGVDGNAEWEE